MSRKFRIAYLAHSVRSDWNNGNAHFLRGLLRSLGALGHDVSVLEPENGWSIDNLRDEPNGQASLRGFSQSYPGLKIHTYDLASRNGHGLPQQAFRDTDIVMMHEWNSPQLAHRLLEMRDAFGFRLIFHDTHHRASSTPEQIRLFGIDRFDGVVVFGEALRQIYRDRFAMERVWTLHEAADTEWFYPRQPVAKTADVVWIGNWGDGERSAEIRDFLLRPAALMPEARFQVYGVRYPEDGLQALREAHVRYSGYLPNIEAPGVYAAARLTLHIPRRQYTSAMCGIPTIRVFEALACGIPLLCAPWSDSEQLFREGDFCMVRDPAEMRAAVGALLTDPKAADAQAARGLETVLARHTCRHRAEQLTSICEQLFQ